MAGFPYSFRGRYDFDGVLQALQANFNLAISKAEFTAKGDLIAGVGNRRPTALPVGPDGWVLIADSAEETGLKWASTLTNDGIATSGSLLVLQGDTDDVVTIPASPIGYRITGVAVDSNGDGDFTLYDDATSLWSHTTRFGHPSITHQFPNPIDVVAGSVVKISVENLSRGDSTYDAIIYGEIV